MKKFLTRSKETTASLAKITIWYVISNLMVKGLNMLTTPLFTRILTKGEYGEFSNFTSWESILFVFITFQFHATVPRAKYDFSEKMDKYLSTITISSNLITLLMYSIVELNRTFFEQFFSMDILYIRILFVYLFFSPAFTFLQIKHRIYSKYKLFVALAISSALVRTGVSIFAIFIMQNKLLARVVGYVLPITIVNIVIWIIILVQGKKPSWECAKYAFVIAFPLLQNAISNNLLNTSDRVMIKQFCGADKTAMYTVAYSCATIISLVWTSMNQAWTPWLFDRLHEENYLEVRKKSKWYFGGFILIVIPVLLVIPELVLILGGKSYYEARYIMPAIVIGCVYQFIYGLYVNIETYEKKNWIIVKGTAISAVINILLNLLLIPRLDYWVAAYTTLVGYLFLMIIHRYSVKKMRIYDNVYDEKFIFGMGAILFLVHIVCLWLYRGVLLRYILLGIYLLLGIVVCYKNRDWIKEKVNYSAKKK